MTQRGRPKKTKGQYSDDAKIAARQMASDLAHNSIVTKALARYIEQIMESVNEDVIQPLRDQIERQREALEFYANPEIYKPHPHGPAFERRDLSFKAKAALRE